MERYALISGASSGIGKALAELLASKGNNVILVARSLDKLEALKEEIIAKYGVKAIALQCDLSKDEERENLGKYVKENGIFVNILCNNAGLGNAGEYKDSSWEKESNLIEINIKALMHLTRIFLPDMVEHKEGKILNIGSIAGFVPGPYMASYYGSKAYVLSFTYGLAHELKKAKAGVTVTCFNPGPSSTGFFGVSGTSNAPLSRSHIVPPEKVAKRAYKAMMKGKVSKTCGFFPKFVAVISRLAPRSVLASNSAKLHKEK